jgi:hypothetical protein|tara:strand:+ start:1831 stop:2052 length:222 start_codon:yes stop_codon:yes gene_type:complete
VVRKFNKLSTEHFGVKTGDRFKTIKHHHEVGGDLKEGTELVLESIAHFPTLYRLKDSDGKIWTLPVHSVESVK